MLTQKQLQQELRYDADTGLFYSHKTGAKVGTYNAKGYYVVRASGVQQVASRLVWLYATGTWPDRNVVFIDGDHANCQWANLRLADTLSVLTAERVREVFDYDKDTGLLTYKRNRGGPRVKGSVAGWVSRKSNWNGGGYRVLSFNGREYAAHRIAWLWFYGREADGRIDHVNTDRDDNRIANLRESTHSENMANRRKQINNTSGYKGVAKSAGGKKWRATIQQHHLGVFDTAEEAHDAYCRAAKETFGEFARTS